MIAQQQVVQTPLYNPLELYDEIQLCLGSISSQQGNLSCFVGAVYKRELTGCHIKEGAFDYLPKPFTTAQLSHLLSKIQEIITLRRENQELKGSKSRKDYFSGFTSLVNQRLEEFVRKVSPTDGTVLLTRESGTGKSELAKLIHALSQRSNKSFVTVYCTTLTESLLESELLGMQGELLQVQFKKKSENLKLLPEELYF